MRYSWFVMLVLIALQTQACRSSDKAQEESSVESTAPAKVLPGVKEAVKPKARQEICQQRPEPMMCCAAMIPSCNECRRSNITRQEEWETTCLGEAQDQDCHQPPQIVGCCEGPDEECRRCRQDSIDRLVAYKEKCGSYAAHSCKFKPPQSECESSNTPSSERCRARNKRILEEWRQRCS